MKIVCTNIDMCGHIERNYISEEVTHSTTCAHCGSIALIYSDNYEPIFRTDYSEQDLDKIMTSVYLQSLFYEEQRQKNNENIRNNPDESPRRIPTGKKLRD